MYSIPIDFILDRVPCNRNRILNLSGECSPILQMTIGPVDTIAVRHVNPHILKTYIIPLRRFFFPFALPNISIHPRYQLNEEGVRKLSGKKIILSISFLSHSALIFKPLFFGKIATGFQHRAVEFLWEPNGPLCPISLHEVSA